MRQIPITCEIKSSGSHAHFKAFTQAHTGGSFSAVISATSPRKLFVFIIYKDVSLDQSIQTNILFNIQNRGTGSHLVSLATIFFKEEGTVYMNVPTHAAKP